MKIRLEQLPTALSKQQASLIWLAGDETLLVQEAADAVRASWRDCGFIERELFHVEPGFSWDDFNFELESTSLFASQKILELRIPSAKLDVGGKAALAGYLDRKLEDYRLLVITPRLESSTLSSKWFKQLESLMVLVQIWPLERRQLPAWLRQRLVQAGLHADDSALQVLIDRVEGNLLAARQEIEKLGLLANAKPGDKVALSGDDVLRLVADSSRHDLGKLTEAALLGAAARTRRILASLRAEGVFPLLILAALSRELRQLLVMREQIDGGRDIAQAMASSRVWFSRKAAVGRALQRLSAAEIEQMLDHCALVDHAVKGLHRANPWDELSHLCLRFSGDPASAGQGLNSAHAVRAGH